MDYKTLTKADAEGFWEMMNQLDYETKYMLYEPGERKKNLSRIEAVIENAANGENFLLTAQENGKIVGYLSAEKGSLRRTAHTASIVVGILAQYRGKGIGTEFFRRLDLWAARKKVTRLELTVICENKAAVHLYEKSGFVIEGVKKNTMLVDGVYLDEYCMAKLL